MDKPATAFKTRRPSLSGTIPYVLDLEEATGELLNTLQVQYMFGVSPMTVFNWRKTKRLPFYTLQGASKPPVRFDEGLVIHWAQQLGKAIKNSDYKEV